MRTVLFMGQRQATTAKGKARRRRDAARRQRPRTVRQRGQLRFFLRRWFEPTVLHVVNGGDEWSAYLRRMTRRPGWTVQRLAKESGIARSSLYKWLSEGAGFITIDSVFRVADTLGADRGEALRAASGLATLERDEVVEQILASDRSDAAKAQIIERLMRRREEDRRRQLEDIEFMLGEGQAG